MLGIASIGDLAAALSLSPRCLYRLADRVDEQVVEYELHDPEKTRSRRVFAPQALFRKVQTDLHRRIFRGRIRHSRHSYGGVPGRNARMNAARHVGSRFAFTTDLADFFPSISRGRVEHLFGRELDCSPDVARLLAKLCTFRGRLEQGLITSPLIADFAMRRADARIAGVCGQHGMSYTRFVDDVTVSGRFPLDGQSSGLVSLIRRILTEGGFAIATHKERSGPLEGGDIPITGLQVYHGKLDVQSAYVDRLLAHLIRHGEYARGGPLSGPLFTREQLAGRVQYVCAINAKRKRPLRSRLESIDWRAVMSRADVDGLIVSRKTLVPIPR